MYDPYDSRAQARAARDQYRQQRRYARDQYRQQRRYYRYQNPMRGLGIIILLIVLFVGFGQPHLFGNLNFLSLFFAGLAFASLFGSLSTMNRNSIYGGIHGFIWLLGLAICFAIGWWPWIMLPIVASMLVGSLFRPMMAGLANFMGPQNVPPMQQADYQPYQEAPYQESSEPGYQPYQEGYQAQARPVNRQREPQSPAQTPLNQQYEQPQVQYPEMELPPMEQ